MAHYKKHPPYKNPFKPTKEEINKVYENNPTGKAAFLKMLSQSSIPNQNPFDSNQMEQPKQYGASDQSSITNRSENGS